MNRNQPEEHSKEAKGNESSDKQSRKDGAVLGNINDDPEKRFNQDEAKSKDKQGAASESDPDDGAVVGNINDDNGQKRK